MSAEGLSGALSMVAISVSDLRELLNDREHLRKQVDELRHDLDKKVEGSLYRTVGRFHKKFGHPVHHTPRVPDDEQVRFRVRLITEEVRELLDSAFAVDGLDRINLKAAMDRVIASPVRVDLPEFVDAQVDLAWVNEGTALAFGVLLEPALREVERANMEKDPVYVATKDEHHRQSDPAAKPTKPEGWRPPNIRAVLVAQGWDGDAEVQGEDR